MENFVGLSLLLLKIYMMQRGEGGSGIEKGEGYGRREGGKGRREGNGDFINTF